MTAAGHVLKPGETVQYNGLTFKIERVERRRVVRVQLVLPQEPVEADSVPTVEGARAAG